jgi:pimeloyl-ACP methyl ester carboxylesterase
MRQRMFDTLVVFDYLFPGVIGSPVKPAPEPPKIQQALAAEPAKAALMTRWMGLAAEKELAGVVAFFASIQKEMIERAGGNAFDNRNTLYSGTDDDAALNRGVRRYASDPAAAGYLRAYHTPTGRPARPVLSLHTTYDQLVPAPMANPYGDLVRANGFEGNYVQRFVARGGHCRFEPGEMLRALEDLRKWVETGARPEAGEQK